MESSMHAPKNSARQHQKPGCGQGCTARIEELTKMVHALEFRVRNLEANTAATAATPKPAQPFRRRAGSSPPRPAQNNNNDRHYHPRNNHPNNANGVTRQKPDTPKAAKQSKADTLLSSKGPRAQPKEVMINNRDTIPTPNPPREKDTNLPTNVHIKYIQTLHAEGICHAEIVRRLLAQWPNLHRVKASSSSGLAASPASVAAAAEIDSAQMALCSSLVGLQTSRWAPRVVWTGV